MEIQYHKNGTPFLIWGDNEIRLEKEEITDINLLEKAVTELRETPEIREKALRELRELLTGEKALAIPIERDDFLLKFLRPCKFYAESAFKRIQAYYKFRLSHGEYCRDLMPSIVRSAFHHSIVSILAPRDQHGRRVMMVESGDRWNPREVPLSEVFRGVQLGLESAMVEPRTQVSGVITIMDMKGLSFTHILQFTPSFAKMVVDWIQDCVPIRIKAVHIVNQPFIFNMLFAIFKPKRHGGSLPDPEIPGDVLWEMLHHYEDDFKLANSYGYNNNNNNK